MEPRELKEPKQPNAPPALERQSNAARSTNRTSPDPARRINPGIE